MQSPIDWNVISTVFLDMDGTLLDLYFDNYFWHEHVPLRFSEKHSIKFDSAKQELLARYKNKAGTLDWYCVDYWSRDLELNIAELKREIANSLKIFPNVEKFLEKLKNNNKDILLVTNAHRKSLAVKMDHLGLENYFDKIISSHDFGYPKEQQHFWQHLMQAQPFNPNKTLFIDDNLTVLRSAEEYGIKHLLSIRQPDSSKPQQDTLHYYGLSDFEEIMPA